MKTQVLKRMRNVATKITSRKQDGVALVITLMIMLTLVLISLSLVVQSNTEHLISQNEQDSFKALSDAEGAIDFANREIKEWVFINRPSDLDQILGGVLNSANEDFMVGFRNVVDTSKNRATLTDANEEFTSGVADLLGNNENWEVFRVGVDEDGDGIYDGNIRTVIYARLYDNFDANQDADDNDLRMRLEVRAIYPVYINVNGSGEVDLGGGANVTHSRGQSERHLVARFGPTGAKAIRTDGSMDLHGSMSVCGECGSAHANGVMDVGNSGDTNLKVCSEATGSSGFVNEGGTVVGDKGLAAEIYIPVINPYDEIYVPGVDVFARASDFTLPTFLRCGPPTEQDPGNSKYFAIVKIASNRTQVFKAYRNFGDTGGVKNTKWVWRLIGDSSLGNLDTVRLDDCGRVKQCPGIPGCSADLINGAANTNAEVPRDNNTFYGLNPDNNLATEACSSAEGETITSTPYTDMYGSAQNDWNRNDYWQVQGSTSAVMASNTSAHTRSVYCTANPTACGTAVPLPGGDGSEADGNGDFNTSFYISNGEISKNGGDIYSPLYGAVIWVRGNVNFSGNTSNLRYSAGTMPLDNGSIDLNQTWRTTWIVYGQMSACGNIAYAPPTVVTDDFRFGIIAGRDINLCGSANNFNCNGTDCDDALSGPGASGYAGVVAAHEQVVSNGGIGLNGYVIAEDRASCDDTNSMSSNAIFGSLSIHYDCDNPTDFWESQSVRMREWEEYQGIQ